MPYFLTVDWCNKGQRGIFCHPEGTCFRKDKEPHTQDEMFDILGAFALILAPQSIAYTEEELSQFTQFRPLAEYSGKYGIAISNQAREEQPAQKG